MYTRKVDLKLTVITVILALVLLINGFLLINVFANLQAKKGQGFNDAKEYALSLVEYHQGVATEWGVIEYSAVQNILSKFMYEINLSTNSDDLARVILNLGNEVQSVIRRESEARQANIILSLVSYDDRVKTVVDPIRINISFNTGGEIRYTDSGLLQTSTRTKIEDYISTIPVLWERTIEMEIENGLARLVTARSVEEREQRLKTEVDSLKAEIESLRIATGFSDMTSEGIIIRMFDNPNVDGNISNFIIHDFDLLDLVNELWSSGARGIAVGGRRLTTTSSIRCVGPLIHVDFEPISVEPIVVQVAGNPEHLRSGLALINKTRFEHRGIILEIEVVDRLTLPAFTRRR